MGSSKADFCLNCGARAVRKTVGVGRTGWYRMFGALPIPDDFPVPTCRRCGAMDINPQTATELSPLLAAAFAAALRLKGQTAIDKICRFVSQRRLERLIGISQGYLSRLLRGQHTPSAALVALLTLLAHEPEERLHELEVAWFENLSSGGGNLTSLHGGQRHRPGPDTT